MRQNRALTRNKGIYDKFATRLQSILFGCRVHVFVASNEHQCARLSFFALTQCNGLLSSYSQKL
ncbi:hypothetical protein Plhal304r1_c011g0044831 [Plasmopara halstedii]